MKTPEPPLYNNLVTFMYQWKNRFLSWGQWQSSQLLNDKMTSELSRQSHESHHAWARCWVDTGHTHLSCVCTSTLTAAARCWACSVHPHWLLLHVVFPRCLVIDLFCKALSFKLFQCSIAFYLKLWTVRLSVTHCRLQGLPPKLPIVFTYWLRVLTVSWHTAASQVHMTSSSAVAKRPHDASCLSVVSFNSTKRRVVFYC